MTVDELEKYGMRQMEEDEIRQLLSTQDVGILALPTGGAPSMRPLTFWFDGTGTIYFVYVGGSQSRKAELSERAELARFLVYRIETTFNWRSALFTGTIEELPDSARDDVEAEMDVQWRPELFERASEAEETGLYQFRIEDEAGIVQTDLPPELRRDSFQ